MWILNLDLSKAFDRVDWGALCLALSDHGVSGHMLWMIFTNMERSLDREGAATLFNSTQVCDKDACLSPKKFISVLHWAISKWRAWAEGCSFGCGLGDGLPPLLDLRLQTIS